MMENSQAKREMEEILKKARALKETMETDGWQVVEEVARVLMQRNRFVDDLDLEKDLKEQILKKKMKVEALNEFFEAIDKIIAEGENAFDFLNKEKKEQEED